MEKCPVCKNELALSDPTLNVQTLCDFHQRLLIYFAHSEIAIKRMSDMLAVEDILSNEYHPVDSVTGRHP